MEGIQEVQGQNITLLQAVNEVLAKEPSVWHHPGWSQSVHKVGCWCIRVTFYAPNLKKVAVSQWFVKRESFMHVNYLLKGHRSVSHSYVSIIILYNCLILLNCIL